MEQASNTLKVKNDKFKSLGYKGINISEEELRKLVEACRQNKDRFECYKGFVRPISFWKKNHQITQST